MNKVYEINVIFLVHTGKKILILTRLEGRHDRAERLAMNPALLALISLFQCRESYLKLGTRSIDSPHCLLRCFQHCSCELDCILTNRPSHKWVNLTPGHFLVQQMWPGIVHGFMALLSLSGVRSLCCLLLPLSSHPLSHHPFFWMRDDV